MSSRTPLLLTLVVLSSLCTGCVFSRAESDTPRTATEQLLLTESIRRSIASAELPDVDGKTVAIITTSLAQDAENNYLDAILAARMRREGATVVTTDADPDMLVEALIGTAGTSNRRIALGIEGVSSLSGGFPGIFIFDFDRQHGHAQVTLAARNPDGSYLSQSAPAFATTSFNVYRFLLLFVFRTNDIYPDESWSFGLY